MTLRPLSSRRRSMASLLAAPVLPLGAACGMSAPGGPLLSGGDAPPTEDPVAEISAVDALCADPPPASGDPGATEAQLAAAARLACHRQASGLPGLALSPALQAAAQAHADFMDATGHYGHDEPDASDPRFTGDDALARILAAGYPADLGAHRLDEAIAFADGGMSAPGAVDLWISTVYHRLPLLHPLATEVGLGIRGSYAVAVVVGRWDTSQSEGGGSLIWGLYPAEGQSGIPVSLDSDRESPDPAPEDGVVGFPVTASFGAPAWGEDPSDPYALEVDLGRSGIQDAAGRPVRILLLEPGADPHMLDAVALLPIEPLAAGARYRVTLGVAVAGEELDLDWSFVTAGGG